MEGKKDKLYSDYKFFESKLDDLLKKHKNEFALVKDKQIIKIFKKSEDAFNYTKKHDIKLGTFLVQKISNEIEYISRLAL